MAPTLIIVPGSFARPALYDNFTALLKKSGVNDVRIVHTPSVGPFNGRKPGNVSDDVAAIVKVVEEVFADGKEAVLIAHSYGGIPTSQSLKQLAAVNRSDGKGVKKVIYLASVILQEGMSNNELFGDNMPPFVHKHESEGYMTLDQSICAPLTFSQLSPETAISVAEGMGPHSIAAFDEKLSYGGYNEVEEVNWIWSTDDKIVPPEFQKGFIDMINAGRKIKYERDGRKRRDVNILERPWDHCPTHSHPEELADLIRDVLGA